MHQKISIVMSKCLIFFGLNRNYDRNVLPHFLAGELALPQAACMQH